MASYTDNYNIIKPDGNEEVSVGVINSNYDTIDTAIYNLSTTVDGKSAVVVASALDTGTEIGTVTVDGVVTHLYAPFSSSIAAENVTYDDENTQLGVTNVQSAIEALNNKTVAATTVEYDNTESELSATNTQAAIDEVVNAVNSFAPIVYSDTEHIAGTYNIGGEEKVLYEKTISVSSLSTGGTTISLSDYGLGTSDGITFVSVEGHLQSTNYKYMPLMGKASTSTSIGYYCFYNINSSNSLYLYIGSSVGMGFSIVAYFTFRYTKTLS